MNAVLFASVAIEAAWIAATVVLVITDHTGWGVACFVAALLSGYTVTQRGTG